VCAQGPSAAAVELFEKEVRPLLVEKCLPCHGDKRTRGGLKLTTLAGVLHGGDRGPAAVAGRPEESLLIRAVRYEDTLRMPPQGKLTGRQIDALARWVKSGLPWPGPDAAPLAPEGRFTITAQQRAFWAFQPIKAPPVPTVRHSAWLQSPVDAFVLAGLEAKGLSPASAADRRTLLRRVTFDLIGLPPTPEEINAFLADDSPQAFGRVVDRLLASPQYGECWGRHWLDVVRYADARDLIQLPPESDFREIWRYRDWVVRSFNRDLPYTDFIRHQLAGDLLPPNEPGGINRDGLVATGLLALADFVPGDVDKEQMIADCVNDQIDVVGRAFLGLTIACARCHDHKFDPISTEDYYSLAGIFFSTRVIPGPVPGNTPLIRVPLASAPEVARDAAEQRRRAELEQTLPQAAEREYRAFLRGLVPGDVGRYLVAAGEYRQAMAAKGRPSASEVAKRHDISERLLTGWVNYLGKIEKQPPGRRPAILEAAAAGKLTGAALEHAASQLQQDLAAANVAKGAAPPDGHGSASLFHFRADDPHLLTDAGGRVTLWPNRAALSADAQAPTPASAPLRAAVEINGHTKTVVRFDGSSLLEAPGAAPPAGTLFVVCRSAEGASGGHRLIGWEDSSVGRHGVGLILEPGGRLLVVLRDDARVGDLMDARRSEGFEIITIGWGPHGVSLHRNGVAAGAQKNIARISSDPGISSLHLGGPGSGGSPRFRGDLAELRVYNRALTETERRTVEAELRETWFDAAAPKALPPRDPLTELRDELLSSRGPFWVSPEDQTKLLPAKVRDRLTAQRHELEALRKVPPRKFEQAVVVQDGGPPGTRHEGLKDAPVYLRGDPKRPGKTVPRGFPVVLTGGRRPPTLRGSGRLDLADWLANESPLTARVMVNRIWQHHFGEGLVRTANDFGQRGERPTHPELLDYLAARFVESGWSIKAMHRLILLSSTYQQSSLAAHGVATQDPDNRLLGRMNRRRLDAEAIRDSLLAVAGRLDTTPGGPAFADPAMTRRTLYLLSARTGANTSDFGRLFDRADPGSIVAQRGESVVAPQALFFLNDPLVSELARALAARVARESPADARDRIRRLYVLALGRPPTQTELDLGARLLTPPGTCLPWERYCQLLLCTNEFVYLD
jgi:hypothetical protein